MDISCHDTSIILLMLNMSKIMDCYNINTKNCGTISNVTSENKHTVDMMIETHIVLLLDLFHWTPPSEFRPR